MSETENTEMTEVTEKADKAEKTDKAVKTGKSNKKSFFKGVKTELGKVIWPDQQSMIKQTGLVVVVAVLLGVIISGIDVVVQFGIDKILG